MEPVPLAPLSRDLAAERPALRAAIESVLDGGQLVLGPRVDAFERAWAAYCGTAHAVGVANGTDALEIALRALGVHPGDEVATVANAGGYATTAILACGAKPIYVDVDAATMNLDPRALDGPLQRRPRAIVLTHLYGRMAAAAAVVARCAAAGVPVVEDCAQAHGARENGRAAGSIGAIGCFSFYPTKNLGALGDGGALVTADEGLAKRIRGLRQYGWATRYDPVAPGGRNSRLDEIQAAVLATRLPGLDARNERRRAIARAYTAGIVHESLLVPSRDGPADVVHLFVVRSRHRDALAAHLAREGVQCAVHYPVADHRMALHDGCYTSTHLPVTEGLVAEVLTLPCHPTLADEEIARVVDACNRFRP